MSYVAQVFRLQIAQYRVEVVAGKQERATERLVLIRLTACDLIAGNY
jgi:hypothetical protein